MPEPGRYRISSSQATELGATVSQLVGSGLPLAPGLKAAAQELGRGRLARVLNDMAVELNAGAPLDTVIGSHYELTTTALGQVLLAGLGSNDLGDVLEEFVNIKRQAASVRRQVWLSLAYPILLLALLFGVFLLFSFAIMPGMMEIYEEFEVHLNRSARTLANVSGAGLWVMAGNVGIVLVAVVLLWLLSDIPGVRSFLNRAPLLGPIARFTALAQFTRTLALLVDCRLPLARAISLSGVGCGDADLAAGTGAIARRVEEGASLRDSMARRPQFPRSLLPIVEWGEQYSALPEALRTAAEMFEGRVEAQLALLRTIVPPFTFLLILGGALFLVSATLLPMIQLIQMLT